MGDRARRWRAYGAGLALLALMFAGGACDYRAPDDGGPDDPFPSPGGGNPAITPCVALPGSAITMVAEAVSRQGALIDPVFTVKGDAIDQNGNHGPMLGKGAPAYPFEVTLRAPFCNSVFSPPGRFTIHLSLTAILEHPDPGTRLVCYALNEIGAEIRGSHVEDVAAGASTRTLTVTCLESI